MVVNSETPPRAIGRRIKVRRVELGLSQSQLAGSDLSDSYISLLESGRRAPSDQVLELLAVRLRCAATWLRDGRDETRAHRARLRLHEAELSLHSGDADHALEVAQEVGVDQEASAETVRRAIHMQGRAWEALGQVDRAIAVFSDELEAAERAEVVAAVPTIVALSRCLREAGDIARAIEVAAGGMRQLEAAGAPPDENFIELAATLIGAYTERGDYATARRLADSTIAKADVIGSPLARGSAYWNAMLVAVNDGRLDDAERYGNRALALYGEADGARNLARLKVAYGWLLLRLDPPRPVDALSTLDSAEADLQTAGSVVDQAYLETERARAFLLLGVTHHAERAALRAADLLSTTDVAAPTEAARVETVLAMICLTQGEAEESKRHVAQATESLRDIGASRPAGEVWRELGEVALTGGEQEAAIDAFRQALDAVGVAAPSVAAAPTTSRSHASLPAAAAAID